MSTEKYTENWVLSDVTMLCPELNYSQAAMVLQDLEHIFGIGKLLTREHVKAVADAYVDHVNCGGIHE